MDDGESFIGADRYRPGEWLIVFRKSSPLWWLDRLPGRFKHVLCLTYLPATNTWLFFDPGQFKAHVLVVPNEDVDGFLQVALADHEVLKITVKGEPRRRWRVGFNCTQMVAQMLGLSTCALHPDGLWRHCLKNGAERLSHG